MTTKDNCRPSRSQIKKVVGQLKNIFMQAVAIKADRLPKLWALSKRTEATQYRTSVVDKGKKVTTCPLHGKILELVVNIKGTVHLPLD